METLLIVIAIIATIWALIVVTAWALVAGGQRNWKAERNAEMEANRADHL